MRALFATLSSNDAAKPRAASVHILVV
jgi:hypothetical protein